MDLLVIEEHIRRKIIDEIKNLELPKEWEPNMVIDYIIYKIDKR
jgi:hypothetical protein